MPQVNFQQITQLFTSLGADRLQQTVNQADGTLTQSPSASKSVSGTTAQNNTTGQAPSNFNLNVFTPEPSNARDLDAIRMRSPFGGSLSGDSRVGFLLTSDIWRADNTALLLHAGPNAANWNAGLRASEEETKAGHARYAQPRNVLSTVGSQTARAAVTQRGATQPGVTFFDLPRVAFEFQSGNILPIPLLLDSVAVPYGLDDFYLFMELMNQPPLVPTGTNEGKHNFVWVFYTSLQFPQIVLKGYFDPGGVTWPDTADSPTSFTWSAEFTVFEASPNIWERDELTATYQSFMKQNMKLM